MCRHTAPAGTAADTSTARIGDATRAATGSASKVQPGARRARLLLPAGGGGSEGRSGEGAGHLRAILNRPLPRALGCRKGAQDRRGCYSAARLRSSHSAAVMRFTSKRSEVRTYQPRPCMRPTRPSFGVST